MIDLNNSARNSGILVGGTLIAGFEEIIGTQGRDEIYGSLGTAVLRGGLGDDLLSGGAGNNMLVGGVGNDHLLGEAGDDNLRGGIGNDILEGGDGNDFLFGGAGDDYFTFSKGINYLDGGEGSDTYEISQRYSIGSGYFSFTGVGTAHFIARESVMQSGKLVRLTHRDELKNIENIVSHGIITTIDLDAKFNGYFDLESGAYSISDGSNSFHGNLLGSRGEFESGASHDYIIGVSGKPHTIGAYFLSGGHYTLNSGDTLVSGSGSDFIRLSKYTVNGDYEGDYNGVEGAEGKLTLIYRDIYDGGAATFSPYISSISSQLAVDRIWGEPERENFIVDLDPLLDKWLGEDASLELRSSVVKIGAQQIPPSISGRPDSYYYLIMIDFSALPEGNGFASDQLNYKQWGLLGFTQDLAFANAVRDDIANHAQQYVLLT